jgi:voltage-gated potassium channel
MDSILFLILRRLRRPIILIVVSFSIAVLGLSLMPGIDDQGQPWHMSVFQALYVISYTATTIGFGEVPYAFSQSQRLWMTFSIYFTVIPWFYAIGKIVTLLQDTGLKQAIVTSRFARAVQKLQTPFYILCSYGQSANLLVHALDEKGMRVVVIESSPDRLNELELADTKNVILNLCADAVQPENLIRAGILNPFCRGVVTLTDNDEVNLAVAVAVKLMNPELLVVARAERADIAANMASFGTDHIINPYTLFGDQLAMRVHALGTYLLQEWLTGSPGDTLPPPETPPKGRWVVCGYGRFGKSVVENLARENITTTVIEAMPEMTGCTDCIVGSGTEAQTLLEADIKNAVGLVAGTDNDINNLSIVMTAYELNPKLFVVIRKNRRHNSALFKQFSADITMQPTEIIAHECLAHLISPLLAQFLSLLRTQSNDWANRLISQLVNVVGDTVPETWSITIDENQALAVTEFIAQAKEVTLADFTVNPNAGDKTLAVVPILLVREQETILVPDLSTPLMLGDRILMCGTPLAKSTLNTVVNNVRSLTYVVDGVDLPNGLFWCWLRQKMQTIKNT